jgi:hypothetical protein
MPEAIDFASISTRAPRGPVSGLEGLAWSYGHCHNAHCLSGRLRTPRFAVERGRGRGIEALPDLDLRLSPLVSAQVLWGPNISPLGSQNRRYVRSSRHV